MTSEQDLIPKKASSVLGLAKSSRILIFAGGMGDWASTLAKEGLEVSFSEISEIVIKRVKKKFPSSFSKIMKIDAIKLPEKETNETLFSFEPTPLYGAPFIVFLMRALSFSKEVIIVQRGFIFPSPKPGISYFKRIYGIDISEQILPFKCRRPNKKTFKTLFLKVWKISAKPKIRKVLYADFKKLCRTVGNPVSSEQIKREFNTLSNNKKIKYKTRISRTIRFASSWQQYLQHPSIRWNPF